MGGLSLTQMAIELLQINDDFGRRLMSPRRHTISDFELYTFNQVWGNTSGGFEGIGGCAITTQRTYVFVPKGCAENCLVYFGGRYAYSVPYSEAFMSDVVNSCVAGLSSKNKYEH